MSIIKCKCCGEPLNISEAINGICKCSTCKYENILPKSKSDDVISKLEAAYHELDLARFDDAYTSFSKILEIDNKESEAYFGMALASNKINYLKHEVDNILQPICYDISNKQMIDDNNYLKAYMFANNEQKDLYQKRAEEIDHIRSEFYNLEKEGIDYDCFICVKVTDTNGYPTIDSNNARDIYYNLKEKGYKPFFSEIDIKNKVGADYEARILYALYKAECMLIVCSNEEYLQTKWVKNEYSRFIKFIESEKKEKDSIAICFNNEPIESLPNRTGKLQGINFSKPNATELVNDFVYKHTPEFHKRKEEEHAKLLREEEQRKLKQQETEKALHQLQNKIDVLNENSLKSNEYKYCTKAGHKNAKSTNFCVECGCNTFFDTYEDFLNMDHVKYCIKCKTKVNKNIKFCPNCGSNEFANDINELDQLILNKANNLYMQNDYNKALELYLTLNNTNDKCIQFNIGYCYDELQMYKEAYEWYKKAAEQNYGLALYNLGIFYLNGIYVNKSESEAVKFYKKAAEQGFYLGQFSIGQRYYYGNGLDQSYIEAFNWFKKAAEQNYAPAQYYLGEIYEYGYDVNQSYKEAFNWYKKAAENGYSNGQYKLGEFYQYGYGVDISNQEAFNWFKKAAEQGNAKAQYSLGEFYMLGHGIVEESNEESFKWFKMAAENGHASAQYILGQDYEFGIGVSQSYSEALSWYKKAAEQGDSESLYTVGVFYEEGKGVSLSYDQAFKWYKKAAEHSNKSAYSKLGYFYKLGLGGVQSFAEAIKWYKKAAEHENDEAEYELGSFYEEGKGVPQSYKEAFNWYKKAAEHGNKDAQYKLGLFYENGLGVQKSYRNAEIWYEKANVDDNQESTNDILKDWRLYY